MYKGKNYNTTESASIIGQNIKSIRKIKGITVKGLAGKLGLSAQQFSKYENGINRISADRLMIVAQILGEPIINFYPKSEEQGNTQSLLHIKYNEVIRKLANVRNIEQLMAIDALVASLTKSTPK